MLDYIANEMLIAKAVMQTNSLDRIAGELQYAPILISNALYDGERSGKLIFNRKSRTIEAGEDVEVQRLAVSPEFFGVGNDDINLPEQLELLIRNLNSDQIDMSVEELATWLPGFSPVKIKMMVYLNPVLTSYEVVDPGNKESVYTFISLAENATKLWGQKQFNKKTSKARRHADEVAKRK